MDGNDYIQSIFATERHRQFDREVENPTAPPPWATVPRRCNWTESAFQPTRNRRRARSIRSADLAAASRRGGNDDDTSLSHAPAIARLLILELGPVELRPLANEPHRAVGQRTREDLERLERLREEGRCAHRPFEPLFGGLAGGISRTHVRAELLRQ